MSNSKNTKRALLASVLSVVLCLSMLVGSTFAWFTDTASTGVNKIVAGNLDVQLNYHNGTEWVTAEDVDDIFSYDLWEPGYTKVAYFQVKNAGSLALRYQIGTNLITKVLGTNKDGEVIDLTQYIEFAVVPVAAAGQFGDDRAAARAAVTTSQKFDEYSVEVKLPAGEDDIFALVAFMPEGTSNKANHKTSEDSADPDKYAPGIEFGIKVLAAQLAAEKDSFDNQYDAESKYPDNAKGNYTVIGGAILQGNKLAAQVAPDSLVYADDQSPVPDDTDLTVSAVPTDDASATIQVQAGDKVESYEISLVDETGRKVEAKEGEAIKVVMDLGIGRTGLIKVYHKGVDISAQIVEPYDPATGKLAFTTKDFSPFTVVETAHPDTSWYNDTDKVFNLYHRAQLMGLAELVKAGNSFSKKTVNLVADVDLDNIEWSPIGSSKQPFSGTFDGQNHTVKNLKITGKKSDVGFFGFTTGGHVMNLVVENASVSGYLNAGVVAGTPYTSKYTNITVKGDVTVDGFSYVGGVFGKNAYANLTDITVNANEGSYVKAESDIYRTYVGGVVGFMGEGNITVKNVASNIDVIGSTCDVGGVTGIAHYGNTFINCQSSGDVTLTSNDLEIGGIAGVWMNNAAGAVTFENCAFTGTLTAEGQDSAALLQTNAITGAKYNAASDAGTLIIR